MTSHQDRRPSAFTEGVGAIVSSGLHDVLVVDSDPRWATAIEKRVNAHPRFRSAAVAGVVGHAVDLMERLQPPVIMMAAELTGTSGLQAIPIFQRINPGVEIILLSQSNNARELASHVGVFGSVSKFRAAEEFDGVINRLATFLDQPAQAGRQRRTGVDRRVRQDWSKVTSERRSSERRVEDVGFVSKDSDALPPDAWAEPTPAKGFY